LDALETRKEKDSRRREKKRRWKRETQQGPLDL
jgi:hypothetical protein